MSLRGPDIEQINTAIFQRADIAFPELELERYSGGWRSGRKLDGSPSHTKRKDKVVITATVPHRLLEQGGNSLSYWDYVEQRDSLPDNNEVYRRLLQISGLEPLVKDERRFREAAKGAKAPLLEETNSFFLRERRSGAETLKTYLLEARGYSYDQIEQMELGDLSSTATLYSYLEGKGFSPNEISELKESFKDSRIGRSHTLTLPLRCEGKLVGFSFRDITHKADSREPKYLNTSGFEKTRFLYNLPFGKTGEELILVEGELDALAATANGIGNVAAVKGSSISEAQVALIKNMKPSRIVLCFDNDAAGKSVTEKTIERLSREALSISLANLPEHYDPDRFIREQGAEAFKKVLQEAERIIAKAPAELASSCKSYSDLEAKLLNRPDALKTGIASLDKEIRIPVGAITLVGGRPRHGKTTFLYNLMLSMAEVYSEKKFYFFSYEESEADILLKILNRLVSTDLMFNGRGSRYPGAINTLQIIEQYVKAKHNDISEIEAGKHKLDALLRTNRIQVVDESYPVEKLTTLLTAAHASETIGAVFIDYIQRIGTNKQRTDIRGEIADVSNELRKLAVSTGLPLIVGAQFGRDGVGRKSESQEASKPALQALKEAGNLEEDANTVLRVWNESAEKEDTRDSVELEISALKARSGNPNVTAKLSFRRSLGVIEDDLEVDLKW
jgi:DNA primase catalytic core